MNVQKNRRSRERSARRNLRMESLETKTMLAAHPLSAGAEFNDPVQRSSTNAVAYHSTEAATETARAFSNVEVIKSFLRDGYLYIVGNNDSEYRDQALVENHDAKFIRLKLGTYTQEWKSVHDYEVFFSKTCSRMGFDSLAEMETTCFSIVPR